MGSYEDPVPSLVEDLPDGVALLMACSRPSTAAEVVERAHEVARWAAAYADHASALSLALGAQSFADVARAAGMTRQGARKRYGLAVDGLQSEMEREAERTRPVSLTWPVP